MNEHTIWVSAIGCTGDEVGAGVGGDDRPGAVRLGVVEPLHRARHHDARDDVAGEQVAEQAVPLREERRDQHREEDEHLPGLARAGEEPFGGGGDELEQPEEVALDAEQSFLRPARQSEEEQRDQREREEPQDVARGSDVADDLLGILGRRRRGRERRRRVRRRRSTSGDRGIRVGAGSSGRWRAARVRRPETGR